MKHDILGEVEQSDGHPPQQLRVSLQERAKIDRDVLRQHVEKLITATIRRQAA